MTVVGGRRASDGAEAHYSGTGPKAPDLFADCERGPALPGVPAAGARSGGRVAYSGVSMAAPAAARRIAAGL